jgi:hypothetical protein
LLQCAVSDLGRLHILFSQLLNNINDALRLFILALFDAIERGLYAASDRRRAKARWSSKRRFLAAVDLASRSNVVISIIYNSIAGLTMSPDMHQIVGRMHFGRSDYAGSSLAFLDASHFVLQLTVELKGAWVAVTDFRTDV